jgi:transcriptional regulator with XRE-family HTH domain
MIRMENLSDKDLKKENNSDFDSVGKILRYYRNLKGFTIDEVHQKTYIKPKTIELLEEDNTESLSEINLRTSLKQYAKLLGLDGTELVKLYQKQFGSNDTYIYNESNSIESSSTETQNSVNSSSSENGKNLMNFDTVFDNMSSSLSVQENKVATISSDNNINNNIIDNKVPVSMSSVPTPNAPTPSNGGGNNHYPSNMPGQIKQEIIEAASQAEVILTSAKNQAERILLETQNYCRKLTQEAEQIKYEATLYANTLFQNLENDLINAISEVKNGKEFIKNQKIKNTTNNLE